ncbi:MAG: hypothetical protein U9R32_02965 [Bacteroidota bacterium]|nr:hypothetical protein [Bacteroidota bacterium]
MRIRYFFFLIFISAIFSSCIDTETSLPNSFEMAKYYGGDSLDYGMQILKTDDNNYLILGNTSSKGAGDSDVYLLKVDENGNVLWEHTYGGDEYDQGNKIIKHRDGGFLIVGFTSSFGLGGHDIMLLKINSSGQQEWMKTFGDVYFDEGNFITEAFDEGYVIGGYFTGVNTKDKDIVVINIDESGNQQWMQFIGGDSTDIGKDIVKTEDAYLLLGNSFSFGDSEDIYLAKLDPQGTVLWTKTYGGERTDNGERIISTNIGNFVICGFSGSYNEYKENDIYLIKINPFGNVLLERHYGTDGQWDYEEGYDICESSSGGFYVSGRKRSSLYLMKTDAFGNVEGEATYGDQYAPFTQIGWGVIETDDNKVLVVGGQRDSSNGKVLLLKADPTQLEK